MRIAFKSLLFLNLLFTITEMTQAQSFQTILENDEWIFGMSIVELDDGRFVAVGKSAGNGVQPQVRVYFIDSNGCIERELEHLIGDSGPPGTGTVAADIMKRTSDGGLIISGDQYLFEQDNFDGFLLKLNSQGELEWHVTHGFHDWEETWDVLELPNGNFVTVGATESLSENGQVKSGYLALFSPTGSLITQRAFQPENGIGHVFFDAETVEDKIIVAAGFSCCIEGQGYYREMVVFDSTINVVERHKYFEEPFNEILGPRFSSCLDGGYISNLGKVISGTTFDSGIMKLDSLFQPQWEHTINIGPIQGVEFAWDAIELNDESYMLIGNYENELTGVIDRERVFIAKYSYEGEFLWEKNYMFNDEVRTTEVRQAVPTSDGGAMLVGYIRWQDNCVCPWICKVDAEGNAAFPLEILSQVSETEVIQNEAFDLNQLEITAINGSPCYDYAWSCTNCASLIDEGLLSEGIFESSEIGEFDVILTAMDQNGDTAESSFNIQVVLGTGIDDNNSSFGFHPNPVKNFIDILNPNNDNLDVQIFDSSGRLVRNASKPSQIEVADLKPGTYFLRFLQDNQTIINSKFLKL